MEIRRFDVSGCLIVSESFAKAINSVFDDAAVLNSYSRKGVMKLASLFAFLKRLTFIHKKSSLLIVCSWIESSIVDDPTFFVQVKRIRNISHIFHKIEKKLYKNKYHRK